jgi:hypothetical protein
LHIPKKIKARKTKEFFKFFIKKTKGAGTGAFSGKSFFFFGN